MLDRGITNATTSNSTECVLQYDRNHIANKRQLIFYNKTPVMRKRLDLTCKEWSVLWNPGVGMPESWNLLPRGEFQQTHTSD